MRSLFFIGLIALIASCSFDKGEVAVPQISYDTTLTFSSIQPIIILNCTDPGCHQPASPEGDLTTYSSVKMKADNGRLKQKVLTEGAMPPVAPLGEEEKEK